MTVWPEWMPIESAPRTGELVILHDAHIAPPVSVGFYDGEELGWLIIDGDAMPSMSRPTHWLPLPPAPAGDA